MSTIELSLIKQLRDRTSIGMNECKKALEQSDGNMEQAIDLLKQWGELKASVMAAGRLKSQTEGIIAICKGAKYLSMVEINCQTDFCARNPEFIDFANIVAEEAAANYFGHSEQSIEELRTELVHKTGENITIPRKIVYSNTNDSFAYLNFYLHHSNRLGVLVEAQVADNKAMESKIFSTFVEDIAMQVAAMSPVCVSRDDLPTELIDRQRKIFEQQLSEEGKPQQSWAKIIEGKFGKFRRDICLMEQDSVKESGKSIATLCQDVSKQLGHEVKIVRFVRFAVGETE